jgi:L-lactate dehydrogenase (cytochrome)
VQALGDRAEVFVDTGITHGADMLAAVALGARAALIGRAYLYGLMAGGRVGVEKVVTILAGEIVRTLQLIGVNSVDELRPSHVRLRPNG